MVRRWTCFAVLSGLSAVAFPTLAIEVCAVRSEPQTTPLVELYTSEGCSSCPPADRWLSQRLRRDGHATNWLAFHVDYWDDLGWPDRFASHRYTERQRQRVAALGGTTVYTPQIMVGERVNVQWRSDAPFEEAIAQARTPATVGLALSLHRDATGLELRLGAARVEGRAASAASVWVAESVDAQITQVRAGENDGVRLQHDRVVRRLWGPWPLGSAALSQRLRIAKGAEFSDFTAFVQDAQGRTLQSLRIAAACRD